MAAESSASSYMNLLQMDRPTGGLMISPFSKSETRPEWNSGTAFKDGSRVGLDSGTYAIATLHTNVFNAGAQEINCSVKNNEHSVSN